MLVPDSEVRQNGHRGGLLIGLLFATYFLTYLDRAVMATAIPFIAIEFHLSSVAAGSVLSAFFCGYALMQLPSGILADKLAPVRLLGLAVVCWSLFTAMTGLVHSLAMLILVRLLFGITEGPAPAAVSKTVAVYAPREQIGRSNGIILAATLLGSAAAPTFVASIVVHWGWRFAFLNLLIPGLMLALAIHGLLGNPPGGSTECRTSAKGPPQAGRIRPPLKTIMRNSQMRWCIAANVLVGAANWGLQNWLPTYLLKARGFGVAQMGLLASMPYAAGAAGYLLGGYIADRFFVRRRQNLVMICLLGAATSTFCAAVAPNGTLSVTFMTAAFLLLGMALSNLFTMPLLLVPLEFAGTAFGVVNTGAQIAGFISPLLIGAVLDASDQDFALALYVIVGLLAAGGAAASRISGEGSRHESVTPNCDRITA